MQIDRESLARAACEANGIKFDDLTRKSQETTIFSAGTILADIEAQGFVIVPKVPTSAMLDRFVARALQVSVHSEDGWSNYARNQWATMLEGAKEEG